MASADRPYDSLGRPMLRALGELAIPSRELGRLLGGTPAEGSDPVSYDRWRTSAVHAYEDAVRVLDAVIDARGSGALRMVARDGSTTILDERQVSLLGGRLHQLARVGRALGASDAQAATGTAS